MALVDMFELKFTQAYGSIQDVLNVFHFLRHGDTVLAEDIGDAFIAQIVPLINDLQTASLDNVSVEVQSLADPFNFHTQAVTGVGDVAGDRYPTFSAFQLKFPRLRSDMRHGFKRIAGPVETGINGEVLGAAFVATLQALGDRLVQPLVRVGAPGTTIASYVIIKRIPYVTSGGKNAYRLPIDDTELAYYAPTSAIASELVTSQVSRRRSTTA